MGRHQHEPARGVGYGGVESRVPAGNVPFDGVEQGVDDGVSGHVDGLGREVFAKEILLARGRGRKVEGGKLADEPSVSLLREGGPYVSRAKARLDVDDGKLVVEARQRGGEGRGRVALDEDRVRLAILDGATHSFESARGHLRERLAGAVDVQIDVGGDAEESVDLVEHFPMLARHRDDRAEARVVVEGVDERGHFDGLGARPVDEHDVDGVGRRIHGCVALSGFTIL